MKKKSLSEIARTQKSQILNPQEAKEVKGGVVIVIIGILSAIGVATFQGFFNNP